MILIYDQNSTILIYSPLDKSHDTIQFHQCIFLQFPSNYFDTLKQHNDYRVCVFLQINGTFKMFENFVKEFGICNFPLTYFYGIPSAIPRIWKTNFDHNHSIDIQRFFKFASVPRTTNYMYKTLVQNKVSMPTVIAKWRSCNANITFNWKTVF